ncbi:MAG: biopolymer transporter ExbD [Gammaproteobacteria bacterium]|nr:MAG: biopolymer transporter ExbD [Gammaproteobacteria bacterium]RLA53400.1 MAG: biopolymer transporter ExbD [Gammaproteobacteria bacterium]
MRRALKRELNTDAALVQAIDLTPMLDVVFILLIFFIVTASFVKVPGPEVERSEALTAELRKPAILVAIDQHDVIWMDKAPLADNQVKLALSRLQAENPRGGLVVQVDNRASIGRLALVTDLATQLGISDISVSTLRD